LLEQLAKDPHYNSLVNISFESELRDGHTLPPLRTGHVLAIVNEALANITRHAHAQNVKIQVQDLGEMLRIAVKDDGVGLSPQTQTGYGLRNMRDRARLLNGKIDFANPAGKGTLVTLEVPWLD
jgi:signal transduction histidine kinase